MKLRHLSLFFLVIFFTIILFFYFNEICRTLFINKEVDWHDYREIKNEISRTGLGERGVAVKFPDFINQKDKDLFELNGYRASISDKISLERAVKDTRHPACKLKRYLKNLPTVSLIIPIFDEHKSVAMRTFMSAIKRAPRQLLKEVILVDDASTKSELKESFDLEIARLFPDGFVRIFHHIERQGLIRARLTGAKQATGDVLFFMDSHCEVNVNYLPPLLDPIARDYRTIVCPIIDEVDSQTFEYRIIHEGKRGVMNWDFLQKYLPRLVQDEENPTEPFDNPIMIGSNIVVSRKWFWELGGFDPHMMIWGGEQYELSFKTWMCGGRLVDAPCARVGHLFRGRNKLPASQIPNAISRNFRRLTDVWLDQYWKLSLKAFPYVFRIDPGNITEQKALRKQKCSQRNFDWYLKNVAFDFLRNYPLVPPIPGAVGSLRPVNDMNICLDISKFTDYGAVNLLPCVTGNRRQQVKYTWLGEIKLVDFVNCINVDAYAEGAVVKMLNCHGEHDYRGWVFQWLSTTWDVNPFKIRHSITGLCITFEKRKSSYTMVTQECNSEDKAQLWHWDVLQTRKALGDRIDKGL